MIRLLVVFASKFTAKKDGKVWTRLYVPVGQDVYPVFCEGDKTALSGSEVDFVLTSFDKQLRLQYAGLGE